MATTLHEQTVAQLIQRLDAAVEVDDDEVRCNEVKRVLSEAVSAGSVHLDPGLLRPAPDTYARRLLHKDSMGRYSVLVMVWDRGQATMLHDHGGTWCVECVYQGEIRVTSYSIRGGDAERGVVQFSPEAEVTAGVGAAGALIPPFEYHILRNAGSEPAVTLHVYGGELRGCHVYEPVPGGWRREYKALRYTT